MMKRFCLCLMLAVTAQPALARDDAPYYGPMKRWHGIGYKFGYEDRVEKDGSWRIDTALRGRGEAVDMALYRAAERARDAGYRYVFLLGGRGYTSPGISAATIYARPSAEAVAPTGCRSKRATTCYTADVAEILRILGGPDGLQPGVAIVDHRDEYGREVFLSGYGTGGIARLNPGGVAHHGIMTTVDGNVTIRVAGPAPASRPAPPTVDVTGKVSGKVSGDVAATDRAVMPTPTRVATPMPVRAPVTIMASSRAASMASSMAGARNGTVTAEERFARALKAARPISGGDPRQGWTISD